MKNPFVTAREPSSLVPHSLLYDYREGSDFMLSVPVITIHFLYLGPILTLHSLLTLFAPIDCKDGFVENIICISCFLGLMSSSPHHRRFLGSDNLRFQLQKQSMKGGSIRPAARRGRFRPKSESKVERSQRRSGDNLTRRTRQQSQPLISYVERSGGTSPWREEERRETDQTVTKD